jgi:hypothetical protein
MRAGGGLEGIVGSPGPVLALQRVALVQTHGPSARGGGAAPDERAAATSHPKGCLIRHLDRRHWQVLSTQYSGQCRLGVETGSSPLDAQLSRVGILVVQAPEMGWPDVEVRHA